MSTDRTTRETKAPLSSKVSRMAGCDGNRREAGSGIANVRHLCTLTVFRMRVFGELAISSRRQCDAQA